MTTTTYDRQRFAVRASELAAAAAFQYGLARLLAHAVEVGTRTEDRQLVPGQRPAPDAERR